MPTQSPSPPPPDPNTVLGARVVQPKNVDARNANKELGKESSSTSIFVNSEPMREEQIQNAVKFLSHPKVRGSPVIHRRSFLEKKGLTKEEIDEAFQRVPDSPSSSSVETAGINQDGQLKPSSGVQQQAQPQALQPGVSASTGGATSLRTVSRFRFHWSHALIAVGFLAASGAGTVILIKNSILPRVKSWIRNVVLDEEYDLSKRKDPKPTLAEEAARAAQAAAFAATDMAKASQEILASKSEERRYFVEVVSLLDKQVQEMKLMTNAIRRLEASGGVPVSKQEYRQVNQTSSKIQQLMVNGKEDYELHSVKSSSQPAFVESSSQPSAAPHPKSYMEIMAMIQRGEKPPNIRDIDDSPPNPNQQPSKPRLAPRTKPWEVGQVQTNGVNFKVQDNGENQAPWWQPKNARITDIDNELEHNGAPYDAASIQQPVKRRWVPPRPPPFAMPEAAEAIKRPKPVVEMEQTPYDQSVAQSSNISNGVERDSELSKSEGTKEGSHANMLLSSDEIQVHEVNYEEK